MVHLSTEASTNRERERKSTFSGELGGVDSAAVAAWPTLLSVAATTLAATVVAVDVVAGGGARAAVLLRVLRVTRPNTEIIKPINNHNNRNLYKY